MKKRKLEILGLILALSMLIFLLSACVNTTGYWSIDKDGNMSVILQVAPSGAGVMYNDEFSSYFQVLRLIAPQMFENSEIYSKNIVDNFSTVTQYTVKFDKKFDIKKLPFPVKFGNGKFELTIPKLIRKKPDNSDLNDVVFTLYIKFPSQINIANTSYVEGNVAKWVITKEMLFEGTKLRAYLNN